MLFRSDVACMFQNFEEYLDEKTKKVALDMADQWIRFTNGEGWCSEGKLIVIGSDGIVTLDEEEYDKKFRNERGQLLYGIGVERLWKLVETWQNVRSEENLIDARAKM